MPETKKRDMSTERGSRLRENANAEDLDVEDLAANLNEALDEIDSLHACLRKFDFIQWAENTTGLLRKSELVVEAARKAWMNEKGELECKGLFDALKEYDRVATHARDLRPDPMGHNPNLPKSEMRHG